MTPSSALVALVARWQKIRYGFLFLPAIITAAAVVLALVLVALDRRAGADGLPSLFPGDAAAARTALSTIATSLITVAGVTFSITIVTLQLLSQQFTPRALRGFLADRLNQIVAGWFLGVFAYSLVVLRAVRSEDVPDPLVPSLSVTAAMVLAIAALGLLLVFIHHMSNSIQVASIAARIGRSALGSLDTLYPQPFGDPGPEGREDGTELVRRWREERAPDILHPERPGYVTSVVLDGLPEKVGGRGLRVHLLVAPGDFAAPSRPYAEVWPGEGGDGDMAAALRAAVVIGDERDLEQDLVYTLRQLSDIAIRALSPGVNDPTTAVTTLRYIEEVLTRLAARALPSEVRRYPDDAVVVARRPPFAEYVDVGIVQLGRHVVRDVRVACEMLGAIARIARAAAAAGARDRPALLRDAALAVASPAAEGARTEPDREAIEAAMGLVRQAAAGDGYSARGRAPGPQRP